MISAMCVAGCGFGAWIRRSRHSLHDPFPLCSAFRAASCVACSGPDAGADQLGGKGGEVRALVWFQRYRPDAALVAHPVIFFGLLAFPSGFSVAGQPTRGIPMIRSIPSGFLATVIPAASCGCCLGAWLLDGFRVVKISVTLAHQEDVFVGLRAAVRNAFGHRIGFVPDDILPQKPSIRLQREGNAPRDAEKLFVRQRLYGQAGSFRQLWERLIRCAGD